MFGIDKKNNKENLLPKDNTSIEDVRELNNEIDFKAELYPLEKIANASSMVEITDKDVLERVDALIPGIVNAGVEAGNIVRAGGETVYKAIIPAGAKLVNSQDMEGAVRGMYRGAEGIQGHANLVAVDQGAAVAANAAAAAMNVAAIVVGQYYMSQINSELEEINDEIKKISSFLDNEYFGKLVSLISQVKKISTFSFEILNNDELRKNELAHLDQLEDKCTDLLGQANKMIVDITNELDLSYEKYEKQLSSAQNWYMYQQALYDVLYKIADLKYTFYFGKVSVDYCYSQMDVYSKQVEETQSKLVDWNKICVARLGIDVNEVKKRRQGFDMFIHIIPGLINEENNYKAISRSTVDMINNQTFGEYNAHRIDNMELYDKDVQIISKEGRLYYLPPQEESVGA